MKVSRTHYYAAGLFLLLTSLPSWAQKNGAGDAGTEAATWHWRFSGTLDRT